MNDQALAGLLLAPNPQQVALVGEPVFRLSPLLPKVQILEHADIADVRLPVEGVSVMCISLPTDLANIDTILGLACRTSPNLVLVEQSLPGAGAPQLGSERFFAFGFRRLASAENQPVEHTRWYAYRLSDYKQAPDWLNARFWAHPERFDLPD